MKERSCFFTKEQSLVLRGIGIVLVILSHYAPWYADVLQNEPLVYGVSRFGIYGVDIFFLVSGYGLAKSERRRPVDGQFILKRVRNTYLPYLCIAGGIEIFAGGIRDARRWYKLLTGYDYWFIRNILIFYIAFFCVFALAKKRWLCTVLMACIVFGYSWWLVREGRSSFWYVSNIAFVIGIILAQYEEKLCRAFDFCYLKQMLIGLLLVGWVVKSGMDARLAIPEISDKIKYGVAASGVWTIFCAQSARLITDRMKLLQLPGKLSLELYLLHSFLYYRVVNQWTQMNRGVQALLALAAAFVSAWLINWIFGKLWFAADALNRE